MLAIVNAFDYLHTSMRSRRGFYEVHVIHLICLHCFTLHTYMYSDFLFYIEDVSDSANCLSSL